MTPTAVTADAPAVSERHADFLPTDKNYRLTGEMPEEKIPEVTPVKEEAPATSDSEIAAAPEAVPVQEKGPERTKTAETSESRWAKITRENRDLRDRLARLEGAQSVKEVQRETKAAPPAADGKPKEPSIDEKDDKGQFKYKTLDEYQAAVRKYDREQVLAQFKEESAKEQRERELRQAETVIEQEVAKRTEQARKDHADYDEVTSAMLALKTPDGQRDLIYFPKGSAVDAFFAESPKSQEIFYEIGKNLDKYAEIFATDTQGKFLMSPLRQVRLLSHLENTLEAPKAAVETPAKPVTQAPRPPHQTSGKGTVAKDAIERAVEENDSEAYIKEQNARALARRKQGK